MIPIVKKTNLIRFRLLPPITQKLEKGPDLQYKHHKRI